VPERLGVYLICDNYGTHKSPAIEKCLATHLRFHVHYTPTYSSWLNQVERWFAYLTDDLLRRSDHRSGQALEKDIRNWVTGWNDNPKPFIWTKTAEQILDSLGRLIQRINGAGHSSGTTQKDGACQPPDEVRRCRRHRSGEIAANDGEGHVEHCEGDLVPRLVRRSGDPANQRAESSFTPSLV
jgi:hypothetical protein